MEVDTLEPVVVVVVVVVEWDKSTKHIFLNTVNLLDFCGFRFQDFLFAWIFPLSLRFAQKARGIIVTAKRKRTLQYGHTRASEKRVCFTP